MRSVFCCFRGDVLVSALGCIVVVVIQVWLEASRAPHISDFGVEGPSFAALKIQASLSMLMDGLRNRALFQISLQLR